VTRSFLTSARFFGSLAAGLLLLAAPADGQARLRPSGPIVCKSNQGFTIRGVRIVTRGVAVVAKGNCNLKIVGSTIRAGVALRVRGNANVVLIRSDVSGSRAAVVVRDNAEVTAKGGMVRGRVRKHDNGEFKQRKVRVVKSYAKVGKPTAGRFFARIKGKRVLVSVGPAGVTVNTGRGGAAVTTGRGGTTVRTGRGGVAVRTGPGGTTVRTGPGGTTVRTGPGGVAVATGGAHASSVATVPKGLKAGKAIRCTGARNMVVRNRYIRTAGTALRVMGSCDITLINTHLISTKGTAIEMVGSGDVKLVRSFVRGARRALSMVGSGDLTVNNSTVVGRVSKAGSGDIKKVGRAVLRRRMIRRRR
jgi:hypothetical protein